MIPNSPKSYGSLASVFEFLKADPIKRQGFIDGLVALEPDLQRGTDVNVRERVTGPLVDQMFEDGETIRKTIRSGLTYEFRYSSKIARDFIMAGASPEYVWEPQTTKALLSLSRGRDAVLIGGAYFGDQALLIAKSLAPHGKCYCFELSSANKAMLEANIALNGIENISTHQFALWSDDDRLITLTGEDSHASPTEVSGSDMAAAFHSKTIDRFCRDQGIETLDVIMLDIEGGEPAALAGGAAMLSLPGDRAPAIICEIHSSFVDWSKGLRSTPLVSMLIGKGYEVFALRDYQGNEPMHDRPVELVEIDTAMIDGPPHGFNLLAVKTRARLDLNVFRLCRDVSPKLLHHRDPAIFAPLPIAQLSLP